MELWHLFVLLQLGGSRQHNYSMNTKHVGRDNEQSIYSFMSIERMPQESRREHIQRQNSFKWIFLPFEKIDWLTFGDVKPIT
jgi:hypothetical protein